MIWEIRFSKLGLVRLARMPQRLHVGIDEVLLVLLDFLDLSP